MSKLTQFLQEQMQYQLRTQGTTPTVQGYVADLNLQDWTCTVRVPHAFTGMDADQEGLEGTFVQLERVPLPRLAEGVISAWYHTVEGSYPGVLVGFKGRGGGMWFPYIIHLLNLSYDLQPSQSVENRGSVQMPQFAAAGGSGMARPVAPRGLPRQMPPPVNPALESLQRGGSLPPPERQGRARPERVQTTSEQFRQHWKTDPIRAAQQDWLTRVLEKSREIYGRPT